ncbi:hypothetical protein BH11ACT4_BH11ACT4_23870 [soil metagenome]
MTNTEPQGTPAGGSTLSSDDAPTGNDGTAGQDAPSGDAGGATETDTGLTDTEFGEDPDIEVNEK